MNTQTITHSPIEIMDFLGMKMVKRPKTGFRPVTVSNRLRVNVSPDLMGHLVYEMQLLKASSPPSRPSV